jgi:radical SAM protein with 4Fe4S-binding SPASM domain
MDDGAKPSGLLARSGRLRGRLHALAAVEAIPLGMQLELTARCNLRCRHCYLGGIAGAELTTATWLQVVDDLATAGCMSVALTGGEVALRDDWLEIAAAIRERDMMLSVLTNGTLLDDATLEALTALRPVRVSVSLYGSTPATHEAVTGVSGSFEGTLRTMRGLRERGIRVRVGIMLMKENFDQQQATRELVWSLDCEPMVDFTLSPRVDGDLDVLDHRITDEQLRALLHDVIAPVHTLPGSANARSAEGRKTGPCGAGSSGGFIASDGDVLPCVGFYPAFGNVTAARFSTVWRGARAMGFRRRMAFPVEACSSCDVIDSCISSCPRRSLAECGDVGAPTERSCETARLLHGFAKIGENGV